jgi:hypothetical protein
MTTKELIKNLEDRMDQLANTVGFSKDNPQLPLLREQLLTEASVILETKLTEQVAYRLAGRVLDRVRKELRQRQKAVAAQHAPSSPIPATTTDTSSQVKE